MPRKSTTCLLLFHQMKLMTLFISSAIIGTTFLNSQVVCITRCGHLLPEPFSCFLQVLALTILLSRNTAWVSRVKIKCLINSAMLFIHLHCCIYTRRFLLWLRGYSNFPQTYDSFLYCWLHFLLSFADSALSDRVMVWAAKLTVLSAHVSLDQHYLGWFLYLTLYSKGCPEFWTLLCSASKERESPHLCLLCGCGFGCMSQEYSTALPLVAGWWGLGM